MPTGNDDSDRWVQWGRETERVRENDKCEERSTSYNSNSHRILTSWMELGEMFHSYFSFVANGEAVDIHDPTINILNGNSWMHMSFVILKLKWVEFGEQKNLEKCQSFFYILRSLVCVYALHCTNNGWMLRFIQRTKPDQEILIPHEHSAVSWLYNAYMHTMLSFSMMANSAYTHTHNPFLIYTHHIMLRTCKQRWYCARLKTCTSIVLGAKGRKKTERTV